MHGLVYPKTSSGDALKGDQYGEVDLKKATNVIEGGGKSSVSGPTTSPNSYPKGKAVSTDAGRMNPQKVPATTIYVGGV